MMLSPRNQNPLHASHHRTPRSTSFPSIQISSTCIELVCSPLQRHRSHTGVRKNYRAAVSMSGGPGAATTEGPYGEGGSGEWRRIYDRIEALLPRVEELAADRARLEETNRTQHELSEAREKSLHARLFQAEASRTRWKTAYIELPLLANPKITELKEIDLKDYRTCEEHDNSLLKEAKTGVELRQNNENHEGIEGDLRAELRKLKQAYKTLSANKDKEISGLLGVKDFLWNKLRTIEKENIALLKIKEVEAAQATETAQKLQHNIEEMQVAAQKVQQNIEEMEEAARKKDDMVGRLQAEVGNAKKRVLTLDGKLLEMHSLIKEKNDEIQKLKNEAGPKRRKTADEMHREQAYPIFVNVLDAAIHTFVALWPGVKTPTSIEELVKYLMASDERISEWRESAARVGADEALSFVLSWYEGIKLEVLQSMRVGSKWTTDPELIKKRQETAYSFIPYANIHTFVEGPEILDDGEDGEEEDEEEVDEEIDAEAEARTSTPSTDPSGSGPAA